MSELSPHDKIKIAFMYYVRGMTQQDLAVIYECNHGRINEACKQVGSAVGLTEPGYKQRTET